MPAAARCRPDVDQHGHVGAPEQFRHPLGRGRPVPERQQHLSAILRRPAPGLPGRDQVSGEAASRVGVQRRVRDQQPVPQHAVCQVGQHIQIRAGGDVAAGDAAFEQGPQGRAALSGEFGEDLGHVLVADGGGRQVGTVLEWAGGANLTVGAMAG